jgi:sporulation protein YlmC with PRC-barrel domain
MDYTPSGANAPQPQSAKILRISSIVFEVISKRRSYMTPKMGYRLLAVIFTIMLFLENPLPAIAQEVSLVPLDVREVAKGYSVKALELKYVVNEKGERIGRIEDFIFGLNNREIFAVLAVGDFIGSVGQLIAVPFDALKLDDPSGSIILKGASRAALQKLPVFLYRR